MRSSWLKSAAILGASCAGIAALVTLVRRGKARPIDERWVARIGVSERAGLAQLCKVVEPRYVAFEAVAFAALLPRIGRRQRLAILVAPAITSLVGCALKRSIRRLRPAKHRFEPSGDESFPSTHTAHAASLGLVLAAVGRERGAGAWVLAPAAALAAAVGIGRVQVAKHWPTDVAAGFLLGTAAASATQLMLSRACA